MLAFNVNRLQTCLEFVCYSKRYDSAMQTYAFYSLPTLIIHLRHETLHVLIPRPLMIPPCPTRKVRLHPRILHRHTPPNPPLNHRTPIQPPHLAPPHTKPPRIRSVTACLLFADLVAVRIHEPQVLARGPHRLVLAFELEGFGGATLAQEEEPGAVDGPVTEVAVAREVEGTRS